MNAVALLLLHLQAKKLPLPEFEFRFHPKRRWRWDLCWPSVWPLDGRRPPIAGIAVEVHGAVYRRGRHVQGDGFTADREKMNAGVELGWRVFEYTTKHVESGAAIRQLERILSANPEGERNR